MSHPRHDHRGPDAACPPRSTSPSSAPASPACAWRSSCARPAIEDFVVLERGDEGRRHVVVQHLSRLRLRRPLAPVLLLLRAQPRLDAHLLQAARDRGLPAARRRGLRHRALRAARHDRHRRRLGRRTSSAGTWRPTAASVRARVLVSAAGALSDPKHARDRGPGPLPRARCSTPRSGTTTTTSTGKRVAVDRHGRLGDPVRARDRPGRRADARLPAHRAVDHAPHRPADQPRASAASTAASRCCSGSSAAASTPVASCSCSASSSGRG